MTGQLTQHDVDTNDTHTWSVNDDGKGKYGSFTVDQNGKWTYKLDNSILTSRRSRTASM